MNWIKVVRKRTTPKFLKGRAVFTDMGKIARGRRISDTRFEGIKFEVPVEWKHSIHSWICEFRVQERS